MDHFNYQHHALFAEGVCLKEMIEKVGSPCYVYSAATLSRHYQVFDSAFKDQPHKICYAVKANSNLAVLNLLASLGAGFDVVSQGELMRVMAAGGNPQHVVFSGVGKRPDEIAFALKHNIYCFNVESFAELDCIQQIAHHLNVRAPIALRINPDIDAKSHPYVVTGLKESKFGIAHDDAIQAYKKASSLANIETKGLDYHIGSQLVELSPFIEAIHRMNELILKLKALGITLQHLDIGGGLGVVYQKETPPLPDEYARAILKNCPYQDLTLIIEPGRAIAANAGILITQVLYLKESSHKNFCIVDAGMNDLLRPALYSAWQEIIPIERMKHSHEAMIYDVVGPVCESGDFLGKNRLLTIKQGDYLAVRSAGAYGFVMSSNYNTRPRIAEVMVKDKQYKIVRERETIESLYSNEHIW